MCISRKKKEREELIRKEKERKEKERREKYIFKYWTKKKI